MALAFFQGLFQRRAQVTDVQQDSPSADLDDASVQQQISRPPPWSRFLPRLAHELDHALISSLRGCSCARPGHTRAAGRKAERVSLLQAEALQRVDAALIDERASSGEESTAKLSRWLSFSSARSSSGGEADSPPSSPALRRVEQQRSSPGGGAESSVSPLQPPMERGPSRMPLSFMADYSTRQGSGSTFSFMADYSGRRGSAQAPPSGGSGATERAESESASTA